MSSALGSLADSSHLWAGYDTEFAQSPPEKSQQVLRCKDRMVKAALFQTFVLPTALAERLIVEARPKERPKGSVPMGLQCQRK